ncbi:o-succinylbenzoate synthase [Shewanella waksmanii]|uniref:o-succinylbenzoate synthase n=1 Tax=Shewanella waksmanii TaxID=213783 RepID=UPI00048F6978|nr:o-succinylbenzoate synthase [Shewanella waksmanii]
MTSLTLHLARYHVPLSRDLPVAAQRINERHGLVLAADYQQQRHYVEIAPLSGVDIDGQPIKDFSQENLTEVEQQLLHLLPQLAEQGVEGLQSAAAATKLPSLAYGLSMLHAKLTNQLPKARQTPIAIPLLYQANDESLTALQERVRQLPDDITRVKVKVAQMAMTDEITMIHGILAVRPDLRLRLDANQGFALNDAIDFIACLPLAAIEYIEEPCACIEDNIALYQAVDVPFALDETLNSADYQFAALNGLAAVVIKPMLLGDITAIQQWTSVAYEHGVNVILSSSLESSLGIDMLKDLSVQLSPDQAPGIDTLAPFSQDIIIATGNKPCLGFEELTPLASTGA